MASFSTPQFKTVLLALVGLAAGLLTACSSSSHPSARSTPISAAPTTVSDAYCQIVQEQGGDPGKFGCDPARFPSSAAAPSPAPGTDEDDTDSASGGDDSSTDAGTYTVHDTGDSVTTDFSVGDPVTANDVPQDVIDSCNWGSSTNVSVYVPATMTVTYHGNIPQNVLIGGRLNALPANWATDTSIVSVSTAIADPDGSGWTECQVASENIWEASMTPGQTVTSNVWLDITGVLSNATPTLTESQKQAIQLQIYALAADQYNDGSAPRLSGPNAARCTSDELNNPVLAILPYVSLPHTFTVQDVSEGYRLRCKAA